MRSLFLRLVLLAGLLAPLPAAAQEPGGLLDAWNQSMFTFNRWLSEGFDAAVGLLPGTSHGLDPIVDAAGNVLTNLINEPLTVVSHAVAGNWEEAGRSAQRFLINTTLGWGGVVDRASEWGITVPQLDIGLAMCARGVEGGPYIMIPVVGPRTLRDFFADFVVSNAIIYAALIPVIGTSPSLATFVVVELLDEIANFAIARKIDGPPAPWDVGFARMQELYLAERAERCAEARAMRAD